jgi:uncharacterized paraquat-inducible protein A
MPKSKEYAAYCDSCGKYIGTPILKDFHENVCPTCRNTVPDYIPYEQHEKWLKLKKL